MPQMLIAAIACRRSCWQQVSSLLRHVCAATYGFLAGLIQTLNPQLKHSTAGESVIADRQSPCNSGNGTHPGPSSARIAQPSLDFTSLLRPNAGVPTPHKGANTASDVQQMVLMSSAQPLRAVKITFDPARMPQPCPEPEISCRGVLGGDSQEVGEPTVLR
jgi:hypothetical protein